MLHLKLKVTGVDFDKNTKEILFELVPLFTDLRARVSRNQSNASSSRPSSPTTTRKSINSPLYLDSPIVRTGNQLANLNMQLMKKYPNILLPRFPNLARHAKNNSSRSVYLIAIKRYFDFLLVEERLYLHSDSLIIEFLSPSLQYFNQDSIKNNFGSNSNNNNDNRKGFSFLNFHGKSDSNHNPIINDGFPFNSNNEEYGNDLISNSFLARIKTRIRECKFYPYRPQHQYELKEIYDYNFINEEICKWKERSRLLRNILRQYEDSTIRSMSRYSLALHDYHNIIQKFIKEQTLLHKTGEQANIVHDMQQFSINLFNFHQELENDLILELCQGQENFQTIIREQLEDLPHLLNYLCGANEMVKKLDNIITNTIIMEKCLLFEQCSIHLNQSKRIFDENLEKDNSIKKELEEIIKEKKKNINLYWEFATKEFMEAMKSDMQRENVYFQNLTLKIKNI